MIKKNKGNWFFIWFKQNVNGFIDYWYWRWLSELDIVSVS